MFLEGTRLSAWSTKARDKQIAPVLKKYVFLVNTISNNNTIRETLSATDIYFQFAQVFCHDFID
jgi:hypothetical protein